MTLPLEAGDLYVICSDGIFEAMNENGEEFTGARLLDVVQRSRDALRPRHRRRHLRSRRRFRGQAAPNDDMTAVALKILHCTQASGTRPQAPGIRDQAPRDHKAQGASSCSP